MVQPLILHLKNHLITFEYQDTMGFFYIDIRYELKYGGTLIVTQNLLTEDEYLDYKETGNCIFSDQMQEAYEYDKNKSINDNLKAVVEEIVEDRRFIYGIPQPITYGRNFTEENWKQVIEKIYQKTHTTFNTMFLDLLREKKLNPRPFDAEKGLWIANCPSGAKHSIMIEVYNDEFGCGWCKKKGGKQELKEWIHEINMKKYQLNEK